MRTMKDGTRAAEIIDRLRSFYRKGAPPEHEWVDVNELVREMLVLLGNEAGRYCNYACAPTLPPNFPRLPPIACNCSRY